MTYRFAAQRGFVAIVIGVFISGCGGYSPNLGPAAHAGTATTLSRPRNYVHATASGSIGNIAIAAAPRQALVTTDPSTGGLDLVAARKVELLVTAEDGNDRPLIPQPRNLTLRPSVSSLGYLRITPSGTRKGAHAFLVTLGAKVATGQRVGVTAQATDSHGNIAERSLLIAPEQGIVVGYARAPKHGKAVVLFDARSDMPLQFRSDAFVGVDSLSALAYDPIHLHLLIGEGAKDVVKAFDLAGNAVQKFAAIHVAGLSALAYDARNEEIYVAGSAGVAAYSSDGKSLHLAPDAFKGVAPASALAVTPSGAIVAAPRGSGTVSAFNGSGQYVTSSTLPLSSIFGLAADVSSNVSSGADVFAIGASTQGVRQNLFDVTPGQAPLALTDIDAPLALAQLPTNRTLYVISTSNSALLPLAYGTWRQRKLISSPAGYGNPVAITIAY